MEPSSPSEGQSSKSETKKTKKEKSRKKHRPTVCITARSSTTLEAVKNLVQATLGESVKEYRTVHIQRRKSISELKTLASKTYFICCANYGHRLLLLSDTDPDELSDVVHRAGKISKYKNDGVMVLLYGHPRNPPTDLYDPSTFDKIFMRSQPRLDEKAKAERFLSVKDSFNAEQKECLRQFIQVESPTENAEALKEEPTLGGPRENEAFEEDPLLALTDNDEASGQDPSHAKVPAEQVEASGEDTD